MLDRGRRDLLALISFTPPTNNSVYNLLLSLGFDFAYISSFSQLVDYLSKGFPYRCVVLGNVAVYPRDYWDYDLEAARLIAEKACGVYKLMLVNRNARLADFERAIMVGIRGFINIDEEDFQDRLKERLYRLLCTPGQQPSSCISTETEYKIREIMDVSGIVAVSEKMMKVLDRARLAAMVSDVPVIIEGESGTGKQLLAESIHRSDPKRRSGPFIVVNCAAITGSLAESALFGHKKGAFTGATESRYGYFRVANGGTLLLDEISELDPLLQPKLLRVLQERVVMPVGEDREYPIDVRLIVTSNKPLAQEVAAGRFRLDLYQRLNVIKICIPPLRERIEDVPLLVNYFICKYRHYYSGQIEDVDPAVYVVLSKAVGDGNVRQLENIIRRTLVMKRGGNVLTIDDLPEEVLQSAQGPAEQIDAFDPAFIRSAIMRMRSGRYRLGSFIEEVESKVISIAMREYGFRGKGLAELLGISRRTLYNKLKKYDLASSAS